MFELEKAIAEWRQRMLAAGLESDVLDELESHLRDDIEDQIRLGSLAERAFAAAVERMGHAAPLKAEFRKAGGKLHRFVSAIIRKLIGSGEAMTVPDIDRFTVAARQSLELARAEAPRMHHDFIGTEHVLLGLLQSDTGIAASVLQKLGVETEAVRTEIETLVGVGQFHEASGAIPYTPRVKRALFLAANEAKDLKHPSIGPEHILLGLLKEGSGVAAVVLKNLGIQITQARQEIERRLSRGDDKP